MTDIFQKISKADADVLIRHGVTVYTQVGIDEGLNSYYAFTPKPVVKRIPKGTWLRLSPGYDRNALPEENTALLTCIGHLTNLEPTEKDAMIGHLIEKTGLDALSVRTAVSDLLYQHGVLEVVPAPETAPANEAPKASTAKKTAATKKA